MASTCHDSVPIRPKNKESDWSNLGYDDLFDQYIDPTFLECGEPFGRIDATRTGDNIADLGESVTESAKGGCSPSPNRRRKLQEFDRDFWAQTLHNLEKEASAQEQRELSTATRHEVTQEPPQADFLSLGGRPSPDVGQLSITSPRLKPRRSEASLKGNKSQSKVPKSPGIKKAKSYHNISKTAKMMNPSRYRSGVRDAWSEKTSTHSELGRFTLPLRPVPVSHAPLGKPRAYADASIFCSSRDVSSTPYERASLNEDTISPFTNTFTLHMPTDNTRYPSPLASPHIEQTTFHPAQYPRLHQTGSDGSSAYCPTHGTVPQSARRSWPFEVEDDAEEYDYPTFSPWSASHAQRTQLLHLANGGRSLCEAARDTNSTSYFANAGLMDSCDPHFITTPYSVFSGEHRADTPPTTHAHTTHATREDEDPSRSAPQTPQRARRTRSKSRARSQSHKRHASTPRTPKGVGIASFVNFTPDDSAKLLTGVAPSGSSKTKARREKEQEEKSRQFSQAAVQAVVEAGGDVKRLQSRIPGDPYPPYTVDMWLSPSETGDAGKLSIRSGGKTESSQRDGGSQLDLIRVAEEVWK